MTPLFPSTEQLSPASASKPAESPQPISRPQWLLLALIMAAAAATRFTLLHQIPPGLWYDEALYALDGYKVSQGYFALFFAEHGHPREPLFPWLLGLAFSLFEPTVTVARGVSALGGVLAVALMFPVARRFMSPSWALAATAAFAAFRWHIHFSRTIFRAGLSSTLTLLTVWLFLRWQERRRPLDAALCGAAAGACLYTYISLRVIPALLALWIGWMLWTRTATLRRDGRQIALMFATMLVVFLPLGIDYLRHPEHFSGRTDEITLFEKDVEIQNADGTTQITRMKLPLSESLSVITENAWGVARVWFIKGDYVPRHGVPYRPIFDPATGVLFAAGFGLCLWSILQAILRRPGRAKNTAQMSDLSPQHPAASIQPFILLSWITAFSMASVLSFGAPNILRIQGAAPAAILLMILGLQKAMSLLPAGNLRRIVPALVLVLFASLQLNDYFRIFPRDPRVRQAFGADFFYAPAKAADDLAPTVETVYLPAEFLASLQVKFTTIRQPNIVPYEPNLPLPAAANGSGKTAWLITARSISLAHEAGQAHEQQLQDTPNTRHIQAFTLPITNQNGQLTNLEPWAELWIN